MFGAEIKRLMDVGGLTAADIAHWLDEPRSTVNGWIYDDIKPMSFKRVYLWSKLNALKKTIAKHRGCVIPQHIRARDRKAYLIRLRDGIV
jgi:hypothetical protein